MNDDRNRHQTEINIEMAVSVALHAQEAEWDKWRSAALHEDQANHDRREGGLDARERELDEREWALDQREDDLDKRAMRADVRDRVADQREIDAELGYCPAAELSQCVIPPRG
ncbi:hypothetical protein [Kutzneria sp. CA-103260]|uniref:hypothetical protein n=1 Tax=Kutzneria sp. CA-103260 TaxID=2802641 RepID=UPI001BA77E6E|nr:hypothetical protein [Kutzneria sp. CA-103260]QUQ70346.1 hypothetical protein JJ691_81210 [Kutzneria sp. CA-103260]